MQAAVRDPVVVKLMDNWDATPYEPKYATPSTMHDKMSSQVEMWTRLIQSAGLNPQ